MVAEKKTLSSSGPSAPTARENSSTTPAPESRERPTARGMDVRVLAAGVTREVPTEPPPRRRFVDTADWLGPLQEPRERARERTTERAAPGGETAGLTEPARPDEAPEPPRFDSARPAGKYSSSPTTPSDSLGYYSMRPPRADRVSIPPAPRLPDFELDEVGPQARRDLGGRARSGRPDSMRPDTLRPDTVRGSSLEPAKRSAAPGLSKDAGRISSPPPPPLQELERTSSRAVHSERPSAAPPRVYFAPHVRKQAQEWVRTGSLSLPGCPSPRHARALQRALLLAMLHEPGFAALPLGLRQRAGWLFNDGWESSAGSSHPFREIDDLAVVLGLPVNADSRRRLSMAVAALVPAGPPAG